MLDVLVVDDDAGTRLLLAAAAQRMGHRVFQAADGMEAWETYEAITPALVISDWHMPRLDGLELCRRIKARDSHTFVLLVTARDTHEALEEALAAGVDDYISKPVQAGPFRARMRIAARRIADSAARRSAEEEVARMRWLLGVNQTARTFQHEINNPLAALYGCLELLIDRRATDPESAAMANTAIAQAERITEVVRRLSDFTGGPTVEPVPGVTILDLKLAPDQPPPGASAAVVNPTSPLVLVR